MLCTRLWSRRVRSAVRRTLARGALGLCLLLTMLGCAVPGADDQAPVTEQAGPGQEWRPRTPVQDLPSLTEEEKRQIRELDLARRAADLRLDDPPPTWELVRWITPDEVGEVSKHCLEELGFSVESASDGHGYRLAQPLPESQVSAYHEAVYSCASRYTVDPTYGQGLTDDQLRVVHEYYTDVLMPCMAELGFAPSTVPSREQFPAAYRNEGWTPFNELDKASLDKVQQSCALEPPLGALFGR